nr:9339_t:CDS:2 [Entrophospora candida]
MGFKRSSSTPTRPATPMIDEPISKYQQPLIPGPLTSPIILPFKIGSTIVNSKDGLEYQLIRPLGNGSYAVVYMVREKSTNKFYALKCLSKAELNDDHLEVQRNEVLLHEKLSHPNIVKLEHYFETSEWLFLVLEYCEGQDLYYWLTQNNDAIDTRTGKRLSEHERINLVEHVFMQILEAVGYCHSKGIAHRDLKPENFIVMVNKDNKKNKNKSGHSDNNGYGFEIQIKLTDFGLATDEVESIDFDCGSKPYMSYECRNPIDETYNTRLADIWSLGIIFLNLVYHRSPWSDPNPDQCKSFATFRTDKVGFLMRKFPRIPKKVAYFLANYVFNSPEKGRIEIDQWKLWCEDLNEKMNTAIDSTKDESYKPSSLNSSSRSSNKEDNNKYNIDYDDNYDGDDDHVARHDSWSDILGAFEINNDNDYSPTEQQPIIITNANAKPPSLTIVVNDNENLDYDDSIAANNSDADSGFGTDEDTNNCNDYHQRDDASPSSPTTTTFNDHWSSSNQRRERVEKRRKEKQEQQLSVWGANRRRGSLTNNNNFSNESTSPSPWDSFNNRYNQSKNVISKRSAPSLHHSPRKTKSSQSIKNSHRTSFPTTTTAYYHPYQSNETTTTTTKSSSTDPVVLSTPKDIISNNNKNDVKNSSFASSRVTFSITTASKAESTITSSRDNNDNNKRTGTRSPPPSKYFEKTPKKKVAKSTKTNLSKMLTGVVMFNRGVKVGGQSNNEF